MDVQGVLLDIGTSMALPFGAALALPLFLFVPCAPSLRLTPPVRPLPPFLAPELGNLSLRQSTRRRGGEREEVCRVNA